MACKRDKETEAAASDRSVNGVKEVPVSQACCPLPSPTGPNPQAHSLDIRTQTCTRCGDTAVSK